MDRMNGKSDALFCTLYSENYKDLLKYAYRLTYEKNSAEEIVQDAFTEAYRKIDLLRQHDNPVGWLYIAVKNISKTYIKENRIIKKMLPFEDYQASASDEGSEEQFLQNYLSEEESKLLLQFYKYGKTLKEISDGYSISLSACKMRLKRAREKLKNKYDNEK
ncbi:MAG: RNA polymerase sigma factor [Oscillospiraceae bacterium]|jgi:RNA polymerase sigma factor (sigma-70 family)